MQVTKKQHYIPQGLIKHFSYGDGKIFELNNKNNNVYQNSIRNTMCQNLVYEHDGLTVNSLEHFFSKIEGTFIPNHDELILKMEELYLCEEEIPKTEINHLVPFYVLLYLRSGALLEEYSAFSDDPKNQRVEKMLEKLFSSSYIEQLTNTILQGYEISIIVSEKENFIMSDQFISTASLKFKNRFSNRSNRQIGFRNTIIFIPLSSKFYIVFYHGNNPIYITPDKFSILKTDHIEEVNSIIAKNSYNKTISSQIEPLEKIKLEERSENSPIRTILYYKNGDVSISTVKKEIEFYESERLFSQNYLKLLGEYKNNYEGKIKRNDICLCGSQKKYKKCCLRIHERCLDIVRKIENQERDWYSIDPTLEVEKGIEIYRGPKEYIPDSMDKNILDQLSNISLNEKPR